MLIMIPQLKHMTDHKMAAIMVMYRQLVNPDSSLGLTSCVSLPSVCGNYDSGQIECPE
jgi:hypothetical protein